MQGRFVFVVVLVLGSGFNVQDTIIGTFAGIDTVSLAMILKDLSVMRDVKGILRKITV